ncbi:LETM1-like protein [Flavobacterium swingsii]|uniref:LETM1-like protein n=1 Tax=Flavobacterium swingsii TaxID=498292 RepID=A0A1I0V0M0_9FLAO|nr:LETM1-related biofilm-associated protein [Flavobacterium swingsii]SFA69076.1 LETM1-like protein [Flavobacterium swingsii]
MINPSAPSWVEKFFTEQNNQNQTVINNYEKFYENTRETGFLVGYTTHFVTNKNIETKGLTNEELSKIALLNTLFGIYQLVKNNRNHSEFIYECVTFYKNLHPKESNLLSKLLPQDSNSSKLEKIINSRIQTNENIISKNFSNILTNALIFIDVLAFRKYLNEGNIPEKYLKKSEEIIVNIVSLALKTKEVKTKYDDLLHKLFESSVRYTKFNKLEIVSLESLDLSYFTDDYEKYYLIDMAGMAMWNDAKIENSERNFLFQLAKKLVISNSFVEKSIFDMNLFLSTNKDKIPYFSFSNPVKHFYDQTTQNVHTLISRNKNRLILEISQSKELMKLLSQSTKRDLSPEEKKKVRNQLLDICKTIPSLTIFLVPGGSLLLPILIKFIPQLLPSAFNENLEKE